jgi:hypothetical protein
VYPHGLQRMAKGMPEDVHTLLLDCSVRRPEQKPWLPLADLN